jgi:hypothetical protein
VSPLLTKFGTAYGLAASCLRGWRTGRRIVVIESDDWGSIRTSTRAAYDKLLAAGYPMDRAPYSLDALETDEDLDLLSQVLDSVRDARGRPACLTANMIMANPDFDRIRQSGFKEYVFEPMAATLDRTLERRGILGRWTDGRSRGLFMPQLHGREHVVWWAWMESLSRGSPESLLTFDLGMCGLHTSASKEGLCFYAPVYLHENILARLGVDLAALVRQSATMFEQCFGFRSTSTIAPNYCWSEAVERLWAEVGIRYIQGSAFQRVPGPEGGESRRPHFVGQRSAAGQFYLVRNCDLEPTEWPSDKFERCRRQIARAFRCGKPAIIESHRMNYVGSIDPENRRRNLDLLRSLLGWIVSRWPDVVFMSSPELGAFIESGGEDAERSRP